MSNRTPTCAEIAKQKGVWDNCAVPDCPNKVNGWLGRGMCYPHSLGLDMGWWEKQLKERGTRPWDAAIEADLLAKEQACMRGAK